MTHNSSDRLEIRAHPGKLFWVLRLIVLLLFVMALSFLRLDLWLLGGLVLVAGLVFLYVAIDFGRSVRVVFDRNQDLLLVRNSGLLGRKTTKHPLRDVRHAEVRYGRPNAGRHHDLGQPMRPVVVTRDYTDIPLSDVFASGGGALDITSTINTWLDRR